MAKPGFTTEHESSQVSLVTMNMKIVQAGHTWRFLLTSDMHWDNPKCDRDKLKRHLDEANGRVVA